MKYLRIFVIFCSAMFAMIASWYLLYFVGFSAFDVIEESLSVDLSWALRHGTEQIPDFARKFAMLLSISLIFALSGLFLGARLTQRTHK